MKNISNLQRRVKILTCDKDKMSEQGEATATLDSHRSEMEKRVSDMASEVLTKFRLEGTLCDVVIKVGHVEFNAHKIILCRCTSYFRALFTGPWATSKKQIYTIPGVSPEMMHLIINYAYTNSVPVTKDNVVEVLEAADQFLVTGIVQTCFFFLEDRLCLKNCISIWRLLNMYHCPELRHKVLLYILYHFELVCVSQEFLELPVQQLVAIIVNDHLKVKQENIVFEAVLCWINHLPDQRRGHMSVLLSKMRIGLMTTDFFLNIMDNAMIKDNRECMLILNDAMTAFVDFRANRHSKYFCSSLMNRPRLPSAILLVTGGKDNVIYGTSLEVYDVQADCWVTVSTEGTRRAYHGAAVLDNFVYIIGGCTQHDYLKTVQKFDLVSCTWQMMASMNYCRCFVSVAVQNGCIYAMGGYSGHAYCNTVECYKPETNQWIMVAPMHEKRSGASSATLNGKVYICGGFNGCYSLRTAECYDPTTNWWTRISRMMTCRTGLGIAAYKGCIYALDSHSIPGWWQLWGHLPVQC
ncbi:kelch-like protein 10 isoform X2 [Larimichthys crocea]|uniref:kelch-like protein 10 isoform X2 n=1 Tax=Larimichthys crocea TaxID=215358 RepID=UPI000F5F1DB0|nr:kelch-like protein 10 isoform X2 [Larimichthys crocea]